MSQCCFWWRGFVPCALPRDAVGLFPFFVAAQVSDFFPEEQSLSLLQRVCLSLGSSASVLRSILYLHSAVRTLCLGSLPFFHVKCPGTKPKQTWQ